MGQLKAKALTDLSHRLAYTIILIGGNNVKKAKKRFTGITAIVLMLSLLLTACGNSTDKSAGTNSAVKPSNSSSGTSNDAPYELTYAVMATGPVNDAELVAEEISKITKLKINATVKLLFIGSAQWAQQTNLMLSGNEKLDLLMTNAFINHYTGQVSKKQIIPLDDLLAKYGQGIQEVLDKEVLDATRIGGKLYGIPSVRSFSVAFGFVARQDLIEKYQIDISKVKEWADLEQVFKTIKEKEPKMSPVTKGVMTPAIAMINDKFDMLGDSIGVVDIRNNDLKVINLFETKDYIDSITMARKWYKAGYIQKDIATTQEEGNNVVKAGQAFGMFGTVQPGGDASSTQATGKPIISIQMTQPITQTYNASGFMTSIGINSGNPEKTMQFLNLLYTDKEIMNLLANGIEGKHYVKKVDNMIGFPEGTPTYMFNNWQQGNNALTYIWEGTDPQLWEKMKQFDASAIKSNSYGFSFDTTPVKTEIAAVNNVVNQYRNGLETGTVDPSKLEDFNSKLKAAGLTEIIAEKQKQLDEWAAAKK